jgi:hypothetical protein
LGGRSHRCCEYGNERGDNSDPDCHVSLLLSAALPPTRQDGSEAGGVER